MKTTLMLWVTLAFALVPGGLRAEAPTTGSEWPQIRGLARDGRAADKDLLRQWPAAGAKKLWTQPIGEAFSAISVAGGRLFTGSSDAENELIVALDPATGAKLWSTPIGKLFSNEFGNGPRATPTVDGDLVFMASSEGQLVALKAADGQEVWRVDLLKTFGGAVPRFGFSPSALVAGELLVIEVGGKEGKSFVALDKKTGANRWSALDGAASYSSQVFAKLGGVEQIVFSRRDKPEIGGLSLDGKVLWTFAGLPTALVLPLIVPPDGVFLSAAHDSIGYLVKVKNVEGKLEAEEVWRNSLMKNHFNTSVVVDGYIYGFDNATFKCLDAKTGEQKWAYRGFGKGSLVEADGLLFVLADDGRMALVEANPTAYQEKGLFQATTGKAWTPPALALGKLFLRDQDEIVVYDLRAGA